MPHIPEKSLENTVPQIWPKTKHIKYLAGHGTDWQKLLLFFFNLHTAASKAYCAIWVIRSNFRHQASPRVSPRESIQRRKVELQAGNVREFCLNADFHVTFRDRLLEFTIRDLLHATTWDRWLYFPSEGRHAEDFFRPKNPTASAGCETANLGTKGQHATSRPAKPLPTAVTVNWCVLCAFGVS
jgi:hypothetical protein